MYIIYHWTGDRPIQHTSSTILSSCTGLFRTTAQCPGWKMTGKPSRRRWKVREFKGRKSDAQLSSVQKPLLVDDCRGLYYTD